MSVELLLIPLGLAAYAAWKEGHSVALCERCRSTAIQDQSLLVAALETMGAVDLVEHEGRVQCSSAFGQLTFQRIGDTFLGRVDDHDDATTHMLDQLAVATGRVAQSQSVASIKQQASDMGMTLIMQTQEDGTIELVFEVAT